MAIHLLCVWHLLNAVWRYLWHAKNGVLKQHRPHLMTIFRALVYCKSDEEYTVAMDKLLTDDLVGLYPNYLTHLEQEYFHRHEKWALAVRYRDNLPTHAANTSNFVERAFLVTKAQQFGRSKVKTIMFSGHLNLIDFSYMRG